VGRRLARLAILFVVAPAAVGGLLALLLVSIGFEVGSSSATSVHVEPPRPKPIAISQGACPYLDAVRSTSAAASASIISLFLAAGGPREIHPVVTPQAAAIYRRLLGQLGALDFALRVSATKMPYPIAWRLANVASDVEQGRKALASSRPPDYFPEVMNPLSDGVSKLGYASDLVGMQCGFKLSEF
jgi:hypothetical protein